jgi:hypothetical protein
MTRTLAAELVWKRAGEAVVIQVDFIRYHIRYRSCEAIVAQEKASQVRALGNRGGDGACDAVVAKIQPPRLKVLILPMLTGILPPIDLRIVGGDEEFITVFQLCDGTSNTSGELVIGTLPDKSKYCKHAVAVSDPGGNGPRP